jgi:hypothetical protein
MTNSFTGRAYWLRVLLRFAFVVVGLAAWFWTQAQLGNRPKPERDIDDGVLELLEAPNRHLRDHPGQADLLLIVSSGVIDGLGVFLLAMAIFGPTVRPFLGLLILFALRQICQSLCALKAPEGLIWHDPGVPSLLVTYDVANDFFFSGHTALAVLGVIEMVRFGGRRWWLLGAPIMLFQATTVLVLRVHYFMDVFTGAIAAGYVAMLAGHWAPWVDNLLGRSPSRQAVVPWVEVDEPAPVDYGIQDLNRPKPGERGASAP